MYIYLKNVVLGLLISSSFLWSIKLFLALLPLLRRGALLSLLLLLLVGSTSIALSRVIILFFNYTIFLILYSLVVSTNTSGRDG